MKTSELNGAALDWAVAVCRQGYDPHVFPYSTDWARGGPIIEQEKLSVTIQQGDPPLWFASCPRYYFKGHGPTPLIAAMRCFVASRLGDDVEIPNELQGEKQ